MYNQKLNINQEVKKKQEKNTIQILSSELISTALIKNYAFDNTQRYHSSPNSLKVLFEDDQVLPSNYTIKYSFKLPVDDLSIRQANQWGILVQKSEEILPLYHAQVRNAFQEWENCFKNIKFQEDNINPNVHIFQYKHYKHSDVLGFCTSRVPNVNSLIGIQSKLINNGKAEHTILHEIGHLLGLNHPFESPYINKSDPFSHSTGYSIMNYDNFEEDLTSYKPYLLMPHDIDAVQFLYGKNPTYKIGNDVYYLEQFIDKDDRLLSDNSISSLPWDAGGIDTVSAEHITGDVTINLNRYGLSETIDGKIWTPNIKMENVVGNQYKNTVILNELDNLVNVTQSSKTTIKIDPKHCGKDIINGFVVPRDKLILNYELEAPNFSVNELNHTLPSIEIKFDENNSITLMNVTKSDLEFCKNSTIELEKGTSSYSIHTKDVADEIDLLKESPHSEYLEKALGWLPKRLCLDFAEAFGRGVALTFINELSDEMLKRYGCTIRQRQIAAMILNAAYVLVSGSLVSNTIGILTTSFLGFLGFTNETVLSTGFAMSIGFLLLSKESYSPGTMIKNTVINTFGSALGHNFLLWAKNKIMPSEKDIEKTNNFNS